MAGDAFKKVLAGQKLQIPAAAYNAFLEQARPAKAEFGAEARGSRGWPWVRVKNTSGAARARFSILGIDTPIVTPTANLGEFKRGVALKGITPTTASHTAKFVVLDEPLANNKTGWAIAAGPAICKVTGAAQSFAEVTNSDATKLTMSATGSARVLWAESGTGERWAVVRLGEAAGSSTSFSGALVYKDANQSIATWAGSWTTVEWPAEDYDTDGYHDNSTNNDRLTVAETGKYLLICNLFWPSGLTGSRHFEVSVWNASSVRQHLPISLGRLATDIALGSGGGHNTPCFGGSAIVEMEAGWYASVRVAQDSGSSQNITSDTLLRSNFSITRMR